MAGSVRAGPVSNSVSSSSRAASSTPRGSAPQRHPIKKAKQNGQFKELLGKLGEHPRRPFAGPAPKLGGKAKKGEEAPPAPPEPMAPRREREEPAPKDDLPPFDPMVRSLAHPVLAPPLQAPPPPAVDPAALPVVPLDTLLQRLVKRVAWGGDGRRGAARLTLGAGKLDGATVTVLSEPDGLVVEVDLPPGMDGAALCDRIEKRLADRGLPLREITVR